MNYPYELIIQWSSRKIVELHYKTSKSMSNALWFYITRFGGIINAIGVVTPQKSVEYHSRDFSDLAKKMVKFRGYQIPIKVDVNKFGRQYKSRKKPKKYPTDYWSRNKKRSWSNEMNKPFDDDYLNSKYGY